MESSIQPKVETPKESLYNALRSNPSVNRNTTFQMYEEIFGHLECWQLVLEQDRLDIFTEYILSLFDSEIKEKMDKMECAEENLQNQIKFYENRL